MRAKLLVKTSNVLDDETMILGDYRILFIPVVYFYVIIVDLHAKLRTFDQSADEIAGKPSRVNANTYIIIEFKRTLHAIRNYLVPSCIFYSQGKAIIYFVKWIQFLDTKYILCEQFTT